MKILIKNEDPLLTRDEEYRKCLEKMETVFENVKNQISTLNKTNGIELNGVQNAHLHCQSPI
jgi:hypothetical protein